MRGGWAAEVATVGGHDRAARAWLLRVPRLQRPAVRRPGGRDRGSARRWFEPARIVDVGCGWGELLLRTLAAAPAATGLGVDTDARVIERANANAAHRGLAERVTFTVEPAGATAEPADVVICVGSDHAYGERQDAALKALHDVVRPGGRLFFGTGFWERPPTEAEAESIGMRPDLPARPCRPGRPHHRRRLPAAVHPDGQPGRMGTVRGRLPGRLGDLAGPVRRPLHRRRRPRAVRQAPQRMAARLAERPRLRLPHPRAASPLATAAPPPVAVIMMVIMKSEHGYTPLSLHDPAHDHRRNSA